MYGIPNKLFGDAFPFHLIVDRSMNLVQFGHSFDRIGVELALKQPFADHFVIQRPPIPCDFDAIQQVTNVIYKVQCLSNQLILRYQILVDNEHDHLIFIGSPLLTNKEELQTYNLKLNDFALHDALPDFLLVLQPKEVLLTETKYLAEQLQLRQEILEQSKRELEEQVEARTKDLQHAKEVAERARRAAEEARATAEAANRAKSDFLSKMSHELRTPLNGILGFAQILGRDHSLTTKQVESINIIKESGRHLLALINDILDFSRIEARKIVLTPTDIHLPNFLSTLVDTVRPQAEKKGLTFEATLGDKLPEAVQADPTRLRQALLNLLNNAIKFTREGTITFAALPLETNGEQQRIRFTVNDTGTGISTEDLRRIFLPFEQTRYGQQLTEGTGLGLTITQELLALMDGELQVTSQMDQGSRFWVDLDLPLATTLPTDNNEFGRSIIGYLGEHRTILIVDDRPENRWVLQNMLDPLGFTLLEAENGQDAVKIAQQVQPDLILMDLLMPEVDGFTATQAIRQIPLLSSIKIVAVSAKIFPEDEARSLEVGCQAFLPKPVDEADLLDTIAHLLSLSWLYQDNVPPVPETQPSSPLIPPPDDILDTLFDLAQLGKMRAIRDQADQIEQLGSTFIPFAHKLRTLANAFEDEEILILIEQYRGVA
ncbi:MAG: ATP-binding protein [Chloroflexota bacterium]